MRRSPYEHPLHTGEVLSSGTEHADQVEVHQPTAMTGDQTTSSRSVLQDGSGKHGPEQVQQNQASHVSTAQGQTVLQAPTSQGQTVHAPTSQGQTVQAPTSQGQTVQAPTSQGQTVQAPTSQGQTVQGPTSQGQTVQGPTCTSQGQSVQSPTLAPGQVPQGPTLAPGQVPQGPTLAPGQVPQGPTLAPGQVPQGPTLAPGQVPQGPTLAPGQVPQGPTLAPGQGPVIPGQPPFVTYMCQFPYGYAPQYQTAGFMYQYPPSIQPPPANQPTFGAHHNFPLHSTPHAFYPVGPRPGTSAVQGGTWPPQGTPFIIPYPTTVQPYAGATPPQATPPQSTPPQGQDACLRNSWPQQLAEHQYDTPVSEAGML